jgi:hypothetical protein fulcA4_01132
MLPEIVLLVCKGIQKEILNGHLLKGDNELIFTTSGQMSDIILKCRKNHSAGWSKEYREMNEELLVENVLEYMKNWMMIRFLDEQIIILPAVGRTAGVYPEDFNGGEEN